MAKLEIVVSEQLLQRVVDTVRDVAGTGCEDDGKVFVIRVHDAVKVGSGHAAPAFCEDRDRREPSGQQQTGSDEGVMRIRSFAIKRRNRRESPWWGRAALALIALMIVAVVVIAIRNVRRHDALTRWRSSLELVAGNPPWPEWSPGWPALPVPRAGRHRPPQDLRGVYAYAATHAKLLAQIPCFCGCAGQGHRSLLNCFVAGFGADGTPTWTDHSFDCPMCIHIAREVMLMELQGLTVDQLQSAIDQQYSRGDVLTLTPLASHRLEG